MKINLTQVNHKKGTHLKAEFTAEVTFIEEKIEDKFTLLNLNAVIGDKGLVEFYVTLPGETESEETKKEIFFWGGDKYTKNTHFFYNDAIKDAIEIEIARYLSKVDIESPKESEGL